MENKENFFEKAESLVARMTLQEKIHMLTGDGWWKTHSIQRLGIPSIRMTDGPHGLRKIQGANMTVSVPATCFPTASAMASSWDPGLLRKVGTALAEECQANDVQILLGPGNNLKRSPLGGRNFEYYSEDPHLSGTMASAFIQGVQGGGVGTSLKHFAANNQEFERLATSSNMDERTLRELYLRAFEIPVKEAQPWSVMAAYNKLNGTYATENSWLLQETLRDLWGFQGFVVSDWGAVNDRVEGLKSGNNLEMPGTKDYNSRKILQAVKAGIITKTCLGKRAAELLAVVLRAKACQKRGSSFSRDAHHQLARQVASESIVLLKNKGGLLPLNSRRARKIALIGAFAKSPRFQGAGSSQVNPTRVSNAFDELTRLGGNDFHFNWAKGYEMNGTTSKKLVLEAVRLAKKSELVVLFAGLPDSYESEGFDRITLDLPAGHNNLIETVAKAQPNLAVVLMNGSSVAMPWVHRAQAIVEGWLGGQAGSGAIADILLGKVNPSGKLSETFPVRLEDTPAFPEFPGENLNTNYGEGLHIGYRHYDARKIEPLFPFGFGLSYTTFAFSGLFVSRVPKGFRVTCTVKNTGKVEGAEVVQLYIHEQQPRVTRPVQELKAFERIFLKPGVSKKIHFRLDDRAFAYWDVRLHDWNVIAGKFDIRVGSSSRDLPLFKTIDHPGTPLRCPPLTRDSMGKEFTRHPKGKIYLRKLLYATGLMESIGGRRRKTVKLNPEEKADIIKAEKALMAFLNELPVKKISLFSEGKFTDRMLETILRKTR